MITVAIRQKNYGGTAVLGQVSFSVAKGETLALVGPSGIGKSTLLRILAGLDTDFSGEISLPARRAMVFQEPALLPWRTALQNLTIVTGTAPDRALAGLAEVGLAGLEDRYPGQLSLGQQRRLSLARSFLARPELLLMDEPFVSLDARLVEDMLDLTEALLADRSIATIFVTHDKAEAERLATRIVELTGQPATLRDA